MHECDIRRETHRVNLRVFKLPLKVSHDFLRGEDARKGYALGSLMIYKAYCAGKASKLLSKVVVTCTKCATSCPLCMSIWDHDVLYLVVPMHVHAGVGLHPHERHLEPYG